MSTSKPLRKETFRHKSQVLTIVGEQVSLKPTGLAGADNIMVSFDEKYKPPGLNNDQLDLLKRTLQRLFSGSGIFFGNPQPNPPCNKTEKELVLKSLKHRFVKLRSLVQAERERDSLHFRQSLKHLFDLKGYIDWFEKAPCSESSDEPFKGALGALSDDDIKKLLKQFVFLILQGQYPLHGYTNFDPNPAAFVGRLEEGAIPNFDAFLQEYRAKNNPIPDRIKKVLEVAEVDIQAIRAAVDAALVERIKGIIDHIKGFIPDPATFKCEGVDFNVHTPDMIIKIFDCLFKKIKDWENEKKALTDELNTTKQALAACNDEKKKKEDEIALLQARITTFETQSSNLQSQIAQKDGHEKELQTLLDAANKKITDLEGIIKTLQAEKTQLEQLTRELLTRLDTQTAEIKQLREVIEKLMARIGELEKLKEIQTLAQQRLSNMEKIKPDLDAALTKIRELEAARDALVGTHTKEIADLQTKLEALQKQKEDTDTTKQTAIDALNNEITTLEATIAALKKEKEDLQAKLQAEIDDLTLKLRTAQESATSDKTTQDTRINELRTLLANKEAELETLRTSSTRANEALQKQVEDLSAQIAAEKAKAMALQQEQADEVDRLKKELIANNIALKQYKETTAEGLQFLQQESAEEIAKQKGLLIDAQNKITALGDERDALQTQIAGLKQTITTMEDNSTADKGVLDDLRRQILTLQSQKDTLEQQLKTEIQRLTTLLEEEQQKLATLQTNYDSLVTKAKAKEDGLQEALNNLQAEGLTKDQNLADANLKIQELERDLKACKEARAALENKATEAGVAAAKIAELTQLLADLQNALLNLQKENQKLIQEKEDMAAEHQREIDRLNDDFDAALKIKDQTHADEIAELTGKITQGSGEQQAALQQLQLTHQAALDKLNEDHANRLAELKAAYDAKIVDLENRIVQANKDCEERLRVAKELADKQLAEANADRVTKQKQIDDLLREKTTLEEEVRVKTTRIEELERAAGEGDAAKDEELTTLRRQKAELETKIAELQRALAEIEEKNKRIAELEEAQAIKDIELGEKDAAMETLKYEHTAEIQNKDRQIAKGKDHLDAVLKLVGQIAQWIKDGGDRKGIPEIGEPYKTKTQLYDIIENVLNIPRSTGELTPKEKKILAENELNRCHLIFFAAYLMGRHFPERYVPELEQGKQRFTRAINSCLHGDGRSTNGIYDYILKKNIPNITDNEQAIMFLLNTLTDVLDEMEEIHATGPKDNAYTFKFELLTPEQIDVLKKLSSIAIPIMKYPSFTVTDKQGVDSFQENLQRYVNMCGGFIDRDVSDIFLGFTKEEKVKKQENPTIKEADIPVILYGKDPTKVVTVSYGSEAEFQGHLAKAAMAAKVAKGIKDAKDVKVVKESRVLDEKRYTKMDVEKARKLIDNDTLNFPFLFYLYLFVFKDYLNVIDRPESCPLPLILQYPKE